MKKIVYPTLIVLAAVSGANAATLFNDDFEGSGGGFTYVDNGALNSDKYSIMTPGSDGSGSAGHVGDSLDAYGSNTIAGGYIKANNAKASSSADFSLSFDFKFGQEANFDDAMIFLGDLAGGNYYRIGLGENAGSQQLYQISGGVRDTDTTAVYSSVFTDDTWYSATIKWVADTDTLSFDSTLFGGETSVVSFSTVLDGSGLNNDSLSTLAADGTEFGFGTFNDRATFDNILITGEAVPEPSAIILCGLGALGLVGYRRR